MYLLGAPLHKTKVVLACRVCALGPGRYSPVKRLSQLEKKKKGFLLLVFINNSQKRQVSGDFPGNKRNILLSDPLALVIHSTRNNQLF